LLTLATIPGSKHTLPLLTPKIHLTSYTFGTFNRWVKEHEGWTSKRREATKQEIAKLGVYNRGKSYFVDVVYQVHDPSKKKKQSKKKKAPSSDEEDGDKKPAAKKPKREPYAYVGPFPFDSLTESLQLHVLSFADVPELGALTRSSKSIRELAVRDDLWAPHLQFLLKELFDDAFGDCDHVIPISQRPNWRASTEFRAWSQECHGAGNSGIVVKKNSISGCTLREVDDFEEHPNSYKGEESCFKWLLENVSLREYYKQAGACAYEGEDMHDRLMEDSNRCPHCFEKWDCVCPRGFSPPGLFDKMPHIPLFWRTGPW
jgi:hypothetical protein